MLDNTSAIQVRHDKNVDLFLYDAMKASVRYGNLPMFELLYDVAKDYFHVADFPNIRKIQTGSNIQERFITLHSLNNYKHQLFFALYDGYEDIFLDGDEDNQRGRLNHFKESLKAYFAQSRWFKPKEEEFKAACANIEEDSWDYENLIRFMLEKGVDAKKETLQHFIDLPENNSVRLLIEKNWQQILDPYTDHENNLAQEL